MPSPATLSIVLPAYNEEERIGPALDELFGGKAAQEQKVREHAPIVLKGTACDARDLGVIRVAAQGRAIVFQRSAALARAEPEPCGTAGRRRSVPQPGRNCPQDSRADAVASA